MVSSKYLPGSGPWARFDDWLEASAGIRHPWTLIAVLDFMNTPKDSLPYEQLGTFSYLLQNESEVVKDVLSYDSWDAQYDLGSVSAEYSDEGIILCERIVEDNARVFLTLEESIGDFPARWVVWPTFINYFDLRQDKNGNLIDPYNLDEVMKIPCPASSGQVLVRTDYLQDYLSARNMVLIRQHDHRRFWEQPLQNLQSDNLGKTVITKWGCYRVDIDNEGTIMAKCFSRVVSKDFVSPFKKAGGTGGKHLCSIKPDDYPNFVVAKDIDGRETMEKPDAQHKLTPTFFDPKVLKRYYDQPELYSVGFSSPGLGGVSYLDQWSIPIGRTDENQIVLWLGDLAKQGLSESDIFHWRTYNAPPRGGSARDFWMAQMMCEPPKEPSIERRLRDARATLAQVLVCDGQSIFRGYSGPDKYLERMLRVPLYDEHSELLETAILLSKIFVEYLDINILSKDLDSALKVDDSGEKLGSIVLFSNWLEFRKGVPSEIAVSVKKALQNVQMLRSKIGAAHRYSDSSYQEAIDRLRLDNNVSAMSLFLAVAVPLADSLESLCAHLGCTAIPGGLATGID